MADEARSLKAYGELPDNSASPSLSCPHIGCVPVTYQKLPSALALVHYRLHRHVPARLPHGCCCHALRLLQPGSSHCVGAMQHTQAVPSYLLWAQTLNPKPCPAVRVNETDAFGEDEDRDEYFDFEDVSEI
jgi:hypothetical protein